MKKVLVFALSILILSGFEYNSFTKTYATQNGMGLLMELDAKTQELGDDVNNHFYGERVKYHNTRLAPVYAKFGC